MATISVQLFAAATQLVGARLVKLNVTIEDRPRVTDVVQQLIVEYPQLQSLVGRSRWAINDDFVELEAVVQEQDRLAMIPPVSGG